MANDSSAVRVEDVHLEYPPPRRIRALDGISVDLRRGAFVAIVGQNGSGKTSLARCISGFIRPTRGRVLVSARDVQRLYPPTRARHVGYVFQNPDPQPFKESGWDHAAFGLRKLHVPEPQAAAQGQAMPSPPGLPERNHQQPVSL